MSGFRAIFFREIRAAFFTPSGWTVLAIGTFLSGLVFSLLSLIPGGPATVQPVLKISAWILLLVVPALSMKSFSDERRQGTWEILQAAPITPTTVVLGKFLALVCQLLLLGIPVVLFGAILELHGRPDWGEIACGLLGLLLGGALWLALGMLASTLTESQLVAYLLALFTSLLVVLGSRLLPGVVGSAQADLFFALDPTRRIEDFAIGLFDTSNLVYFLVTIAGLLWLTRLMADWRPGLRPSTRRLFAGGLEWAGVVVAVVGVIAIFDLPSLQRSLDLTRTRAYALDRSTLTLLEDLPVEDGVWTIDLLAVSNENDSGVMRQVDEVLRRFDQASEGLVTSRIDPLDPESLERFDSLILRLRSAYSEEVALYESTLAQALEAYENLRLFAVETLPAFRDVLASLPPDTNGAVQLGEIARALTRLGVEGGELELFVTRGLESDGARPIPDHEGVRTALLTTSLFWAEQLEATVAFLQMNMIDSTVTTDLRRFALTERERFQSVSEMMASVADRLKRLPPLALSEASRAIQSGEAAIVTGPGFGAAVVPSWQLFPRNAVDSSDGTVRIDRRFRGEEVLAGAIRSLLLPERPMVILVHGEDRRMLSSSSDGGDFYALADALRAARYEVEEWNVTSGERPIAAEGTRPVWLILPPLKRAGLEFSKQESALLDISRELLSSGEPVLLSLGRSILPVLGKEDPWATLVATLGVRGATDRLVLERIPLDEGTFEFRQWVRLPQPLDSVSHPVSDAVGDQALVILQPVALEIDADSDAEVLWAIEPDEDRWLESEWRMDRVESRQVIPEEGLFDEPLPVVVAVERMIEGQGRQRVLVVGGSGWLLSTVADLSRSMGGDRRVLEAPGNRALLLTSTAWLSGLDELVPQSGGVSEFSRLTGLSETMRRLWGGLVVVVLPLGVLALGGLIIFSRRRT